MFKKISTILIILCCSLTYTFALTSSQSEIEAANSLWNRWIINNHSDNPWKYNLNDNVLRQEIAAVARGVAGLDKKKICENEFLDVSANLPNDWACNNIEVLVDNDLISKNKTFRPEENITKSEAVAMLIKSIGFDFSYNPNGIWNWQEQVVLFASRNWLIENFTDYNTDATRWWVFKFADSTIKKDEEIKEQYKQWYYSDETL